MSASSDSGGGFLSSVIGALTGSAAAPAPPPPYAALFTASAANEPATIKRLLATAAVDVNMRGAFVASGILSRVASWLGAAPTLQNCTALIVAAHSGAEAACVALLEAGAAVAAVDARGNTALHYAAELGHLGVVLRLLESRESSLDAGSADGATPVMVAAARGHADIVEALLRAGADTTRHDYTGKTALMHARARLNKAAAYPLAVSLALGGDTHVGSSGAPASARTLGTGMGSATPSEQNVADAQNAASCVRMLEGVMIASATAAMPRSSRAGGSGSGGAVTADGSSDGDSSAVRELHELIRQVQELQRVVVAAVVPRAAGDAASTSTAPGPRGFSASADPLVLPEPEPMNPTT